jgi:DNA polymerase III delta prime subunit
MSGQDPEASNNAYEKELKQITAGTNPDVFFARSFCLDKTHKAEKNNPVKYHIEGIRRLIADTASRPNIGKIKVYLFDKAEELSPQCQNALLKTVEEPGYCRFVFAAEDSSPLLATLLSRLTAVQIAGGQDSQSSQSAQSESTLSKAGMAESENLFNIIAAKHQQREYQLAKAFAAIAKKKDRQLVSAVLDRLIERARDWDKHIGSAKRVQITEALMEFRYQTKMFPNFNLSASAYAARIGEILEHDVTI